MWLTFSQEKYHYDLEFLEISNYVLEHDLNVEKKVKRDSKKIIADTKKVCYIRF